MEELHELINNMEITDQEGIAAMKKAIAPVVEEVKKNAPKKSGNLQKSVVLKVKKEGLGITGTVKIGVFYGGILEYGTSKSKKHVGFFARSLEETNDEVMKTLAGELLK